MSLVRDDGECTGLFDFKTKTGRLGRGENPKSVWLSERHEAEGVAKYGTKYRGTVGWYQDYLGRPHFTVIG